MPVRRYLEPLALHEWIFRPIVVGAPARCSHSGGYSPSRVRPGLTLDVT
ncbi:MAG: hypothetical protein ACRDGD_02110 [Candidatus Limnocylindria bacterium]